MEGFGPAFDHLPSAAASSLGFEAGCKIFWAILRFVHTEHMTLCTQNVSELLFRK